jgi:arginine/lysine/ornithine decarboxylase
MGVLPLFETTTRSNILMLSLEDAINRGFSTEGKAILDQAIQECHSIRHQLDQYGTILTYDNRVEDPLKIFLKSDRLTGSELAELLYNHGIDGEFADLEGLLLIFSFHHSQKDFQFIKETLTKIFIILKEKNKKQILPESYFSRQPQMKMLPKDAFFTQKEKLPLSQTLGRISSSCIQKVPPASPLLIPGEVITQWHLDHLSANIFIETVKE